MTTRPRRDADLPSRHDLIAFLREAHGAVPQKEIAQAFDTKSSQRGALRALLKELVADGTLVRDGKRGYRAGQGLPAVSVVEVTGLDSDGELLARPVSWRHEEEPPVVYLSPERRGRPTLGPGDRVLARLRRTESGDYEGRTIRVLAGAPKMVLGIYQNGPQGGRLHPTDRRAKGELTIAERDNLAAKPGELVLAEVKPNPRRLGLREARIRQRLGTPGAPAGLSLISAVEQGLPMSFSREALAESEAAEGVALGARSDLRGLPLVTIDGADARDFDDAVWAEADSSPENPEGWHLLVAIADVAHYVRPGSAMDRDAYERGNSTYFPDRVIPMLPEQISNGWCSLLPGEDRPCLAAHLWLDRDGRLIRYHFLRGLMRSQARLTYEQVQAAHDGAPDDATKPLARSVIAPLYGAFAALNRAREERGTLDLDLPERTILLDSEGQVAAISPRARLDSHRVIEEFMITANVAAAKALESKSAPCVYRIHDPPDPQKLEALREVLATFGLRLDRGQMARPSLFQRILDLAKDLPESGMISSLVLRAQSQAVYGTAARGHFGLALPRYAHFTSPIRRYSDLLVHRSLITSYRLGDGGLPAGDDDWLSEAATHVSTTERRSQAAERSAEDRFVASFLHNRIGATFAGRVEGVTRFGLFVALDETGADGLVPVSSLPDDRYDHRANEHALVGRRWNRAFRLGARVSVRLSEADPVTGGLIFTLLKVLDDSSRSRRHTLGKKSGAKKPGARKTDGGVSGAKRKRRSSPSKRRTKAKA